VQEIHIILLASLKLGNSDLVDACTALILLHLLPGELQGLATEYLVDQRVDCLLPLPCPPMLVGPAVSW
jgi:hypothetical protein